eukprot:449814-Amphidinium_carterae.1
MAIAPAKKNSIDTYTTGGANSPKMYIFSHMKTWPKLVNGTQPKLPKTDNGSRLHLAFFTNSNVAMFILDGP